MKTTIAKTVCVTLMLALGHGAFAAEGSAKPAATALNIPAQPLRDALTTLGRQTGLQVIYTPAEVTAALNAPSIVGTFSAQDALAKLLANTGLKFEYLDARTVAIRSAKTGDSSTSNLGPADQMRMAAAEEAAEKKATSAAGGSEADSNQVVVRDSKAKSAPFSTGNLDLTRTPDDVLPFQVFTAREIEQSGVTSVQEFLRERLPQNFDIAEIPEETDGGVIDQAARKNRVNMRGWGDTETVFLLNGRRMPAEYQAAREEMFNATPNLRAIPLASIERIEILSSAGSAIYGAGATGGVINIITRQDYEGGQLSVSYATPGDANAPKRDVQMSYSFMLKPRVSLDAHAGYSDSTPLRVGDRSGVTIERWRRKAGIDSTNSSFSVSNLYAARPNVRATSSDGDLFPEISGQQRYAHPRSGYIGSGGRESFNQGVTLNLAEGAAGNSKYAKGSLLGQETSSVTFGLGAQISFNERWRWSIDSRYASTDSEGRSDASLNFGGSGDTTTLSTKPRVPSAASINPFEQDVSISLVDPRLDRPELRNKHTNTIIGLSTTLTGQIGEWRGFLDLSYSHHRNRMSSNQFYEPEGGWISAFMTGQYNPFVDVSQVAPATPEFYQNYTMFSQTLDGETRNYAAGIKASGPLFHLPASAVQLTMGLEWSSSDRYKAALISRYEDAATGAARIPTGLAIGNNLNPRNRFIFSSYAGYAEINVPFVSAAQNVPLVRELELFGSGRLDYTMRDGFRPYQSAAEAASGALTEPVEYTQSTSIYAMGFKYQMLDGMTLRASQSIGFRPPNMDQVMPANPPIQNCCSGVAPVDPIRNEPLTLTPNMYVTGGNEDLKAESTNSTNLGVILTPTWMRGFRMSVDYIESIRSDAIFSFGASRTGVEQALELENDFPGLIGRDPPDGHPSGVGPVRFVDLRYRNLRKISSRSVDFSVMQQLQDVVGGSLSLTANASRNLSFKVQNSNTGPEVEQIRNRAGAMGRQLAWNANGQVRWDGGNWGLGWNVRYFDYFLVQGSTPAALATAIQNQGADRIPWKLNHDINVSYRAPVTSNLRGLQGLLSGTSITFTVQNLFNRGPRFYYPSTDYGVFFPDSIAGRTLTLVIRKEL